MELFKKLAHWSVKTHFVWAMQVSGGMIAITFDTILLVIRHLSSRRTRWLCRSNSAESPQFWYRHCSSETWQSISAKTCKSDSRASSILSGKWVKSIYCTTLPHEIGCRRDVARLQWRLSNWSNLASNHCNCRLKDILHCNWRLNLRSRSLQWYFLLRNRNCYFKTAL